MNYIRHLSQFYERLQQDCRLSPHHISLYHAIFQLWNSARFERWFSVNREELMRLSRIGSVNTYIRCLKQLDAWGYVRYQPSRSVFAGSRIAVITFDNTANDTHEVAGRPFNKRTKTEVNKPKLEEVELFFEKEKYPGHEAYRFFNYYQARGWMSGSSFISDWQAAAVNWNLKHEELKRNESNRGSHKSKSSGPKPGSLHAGESKRYDEPL